ncbi:30S ribosomal protein S3 [endosymbiont of Pachyrhynchus infernalis]|uniref:30S ribosomal protein S3 n=1 Tax=endosymbiont of Pachyrhynchus infernalis TaxID=1971488 RepID=UPI000DC6DE38|nr:30S ribosomal protein S3 [endosymbiont of Pachyrhynchus infernalis]BBA84838.1 30S ribosomal protein S3 [endosymbiont of Pachyrhynchus infernalis]
MGQKVDPNIFRLGIIKNWNSIWIFDKKEFVKNLHNDFLIRKYIENKLSKSMISNILIERLSNSINIYIHTSKPGTIIGKKGEYIDELKKDIYKISNLSIIKINIVEVKKPNLNAKLVAKNIAYQIEKRISFKKVIKKFIQLIIKSGAKGVKIKISGRLGGSEIARTEWYKEGRIPLHTIRADIDYDLSLSKTTYGIIGVKVWIFKGEIFK